jgi:glycerol-3-phosphate dehydrogenase
MTYAYSKGVPTDKSVLSPRQRNSDIEELKSREFDILVIGGGVVGCGIALDAAARGLSVALVESDDFAAGTSSRSSKLIHGGLRYLEQFDFKLVREALHEREMMITEQAPHLVKPLAFVYPLHKKYFDRVYVGAGLMLYDALRGKLRAVPWHKHISFGEMRNEARSLNPEKVTGGLVYYDAQVDDARHTLMVARTAKDHGAHIVTGATVTQITRTPERVTGVVVKVDGHSINVKSKVVIAAAGIWNEELYQQFGIKPGYKIKMSKGVHIILPKDAIDAKSGIIIKTSLSVLFIIPWGNEWLLGTTDTPYDGDREQPLADESDIEYIINEANKILLPKIRREQILSVYAGLRPLVSPTKDSSTTKISREHSVDHPLKGFVSIAGGKYTTYRVMAADAVDAAVKDLEGPVSKCSTKSIPLIGAVGYKNLVKQIAALAQSYSVSTLCVERMLNRYGSLISDIFQLIAKDPSLAVEVLPGAGYIKAEVLYAATHEGARTLKDILARRLRLAMESPDHGLLVIQEIAELVAPTLGWSVEDVALAIADYKQYIAVEMAAMA